MAAAAVPDDFKLEASAPEADKKKKKKAEKRAGEEVNGSEPPKKKKKKEAADELAAAAVQPENSSIASTDKAKRKAEKEARKAEKAAKKAKKAGNESKKAGSAPDAATAGDESEGGDEATASPARTVLSPEEFRRSHMITATCTLPDPIQSFEVSPFDSRLKAAMAAAGYQTPSAIQAQAWPVALNGRDLVAIAKTGSGKTVGFLMPAFTKILPSLPIRQGQGPLALIMAPVRELAQQIQLEAERFGGAVGIKSVCVYGGAPKGPQIGAMSRGRPAVVVGTPGRLNDLLALSNPPVFNLDSCTCVANPYLRVALPSITVPPVPSPSN